MTASYGIASKDTSSIFNSEGSCNGRSTQGFAFRPALYFKSLSASEGCVKKEATPPLRIGSFTIPSVIVQEWQSEGNVSFDGKKDNVKGPFIARFLLPRTHAVAQICLGSQIFEAFIGVMIILNSVLIGVQQSYDLNGEGGQSFAILENLLLVVFIMELLLRFFVHGRACVKDGWVRFDIFVVSLSALSAWVLQPIFASADQLAPLLVLRTARLLKLVRTMKLLMKLKELWLLVHGLISSASTMLYTLLLLGVILYVFASLGIEIITKHKLASGPEADPEFSAIVGKSFADLPRTMLTLIQFVTLDSVSAIYCRLIEKDATVSLYFVSLILIVSVVLMNLVTAVIVNSALECARQDKEARKIQEENYRKRLVGDLKEAFSRLDTDEDGTVSIQELLAAPCEEKGLLQECMRLDDLLQVFCVLDTDGDGKLDIEEFCDGILYAVTCDSPIELKRMEKQMNIMQKQMQIFETVQFNISQSLEKIVASVAQECRLSSATDDKAKSPDFKEDVQAKQPTERSPGSSGSLQDTCVPGWAQQMLHEMHQLRRGNMRVSTRDGADRHPSSPSNPTSPSSKQGRHCSGNSLSSQGSWKQGARKQQSPNVIDSAQQASVRSSALALHVSEAGPAQSVLERCISPDSVELPSVRCTSEDQFVNRASGTKGPAHNVPNAASNIGLQTRLFGEPRIPVAPPSTASSPRMFLEADAT